MNAASLSFASLLLAVAGPTLAGTHASPTQSVQAGIPESQASLPLEGKWSLTIQDGQLVAELTLVNLGDTPVDIVFARGHSPGPSVTATVGDTTLYPVLSEAQERDMMSRMGPTRSYAAVAAGKQLLVGTYRFDLPAQYGGMFVRLEASVRGAEGQLLKLPVNLVLDANGAV